MTGKIWLNGPINKKICYITYITNSETNGELQDSKSWEGIYFYLCRSDNEVKNHLYSKLRKGLRKVNKIIKENYKK